MEKKKLGKLWVAFTCETPRIHGGQPLQPGNCPTTRNRILTLRVTSVSDLPVGSRLKAASTSVAYAGGVPSPEEHGSDKEKSQEPFQLFKDMLNRTVWERTVRNKQAEQSWQIFKDDQHRASEVVVPKGRILGMEDKRPAQLNWDLVVKLKRKKQMHML